MEVFSKEGILYYVQADHLNGEEIGSILHYFYEAGACNVQVIPTITKKNRPSYLFFIDCRPDSADRVEEAIAGELTSGGWHRMDTVHRYQYNERLKRPVELCFQGETLHFTVEGKKFESGSLRPEHDSVVALREAVYEKWHKPVTYEAAYHMAVSALLDSEKSVFQI